MNQETNQLSQEELLQSAQRGSKVARPQMMHQEKPLSQDEEEDEDKKKPTDSDPDDDPDDDSDETSDSEETDDETGDDDDDDDSTGGGTDDPVDENELIQTVQKKQTSLKRPIDLSLQKQTPKIKPKEPKDPLKIDRSPWQQFCDFLIHGVKGAQIKNGDLSTKANLFDEFLVGLGFKEYQKDVLLQRQAKTFWLKRLLGKNDTSLLNTDVKPMMKRLSKEDRTIADIVKINRDNKKTFLNDAQKEATLKKGREILQQTVTTPLNSKIQASRETTQRYQEFLKEKAALDMQKALATQQSKQDSHSQSASKEPTLAVTRQETVEQAHQQKQEVEKVVKREEAVQKEAQKISTEATQRAEDHLRAQTSIMNQSAQQASSDQMNQNAQMIQAQNAALLAKAAISNNELAQLLNQQTHHQPRPHAPHPIMHGPQRPPVVPRAAAQMMDFVGTRVLQAENSQQDPQAKILQQEVPPSVSQHINGTPITGEPQDPTPSSGRDSGSRPA